jgi:N-carbamoylputrescine amidase
VLICWDSGIPKPARITTLLRADVLFYPDQRSAGHPAEKDEWGQAQVDAWRTIQRAHSIANGVYRGVLRIGSRHED